MLSHNGKTGFLVVRAKKRVCHSLDRPPRRTREQSSAPGHSECEGAELTRKAQHRVGRPLFEKMLESDVPTKSGILISYDSDPMEHLQYGVHVRNLDKYAERMSKYLKEVMPNTQVPDSAAFAKALRKAGVEELSPRIAYLKAVGNAWSGYRTGDRPGR